MIASSVNAPIKKGGAGGSYTWGSPLDVQDFEPVGVGAGYGVVTAPMMAPTIVQTVAAPAYRMDQQAFPTLGAPVAAPTVKWGPPGQVQLSEAALRTGALNVVGAEHPRNLFAKKPYVRTQVAATPSAGPQVIDWTQSGMPVEVMTSIVQSAGAAHLGPYGQVAPATVPLDVLRSQNLGVAKTYTQYSPKAAMPVAAKPQQAQRQTGVIQQPKRCC